MCDTSLGVPRPIISISWRRQVFDTAHSLAHPGARMTCKLITDKFVWLGMSSQINKWARAWDQCQKSKIQTHTWAAVEQIETPMRWFQHVHIDLMGPLPEVRGNKYLLTIMDRFTRWPEVIRTPIPSTSFNR